MMNGAGVRQLPSRIIPHSDTATERAACANYVTQPDDLRPGGARSDDARQPRRRRQHRLARPDAPRRQHPEHAGRLLGRQPERRASAPASASSVRRPSHRSGLRARTVLVNLSHDCRVAAPAARRAGHAEPSVTSAAARSCGTKRCSIRRSVARRLTRAARCSCRPKTASS